MPSAVATTCRRLRLLAPQLAGGGGVEDAFAGVRYLSGLLGVARKHKLLKEAGQRGLAAASSAAGQQQEGEQQQEEEQRQQGPGGGEVELAAAPGRGLVLLAHPCLLGSIFSRSVVLLCPPRGAAGRVRPGGQQASGQQP